MSSDVKVYRQPQVEVGEPRSQADMAKRTLMRLLVDARKVILGRVNQLPGSGASTELWIRYEQLARTAAQQGSQGLWQQALDQFQRDYARLLSAAPIGGAEKIGRGTRGVGHADCCGANCSPTCPNCANGRARGDFVGLCKRAVDAAQAGNNEEALKMLARAKDQVRLLGPTDSVTAPAQIAAVRDYVSVRLRRKDRIDGRHVRHRTPVKFSYIQDVTTSAGTDVKAQQDSIIADGNAVKATVSPTDGQGARYQEAISPLFDRLGFAMRLLQQSSDRGQVTPEEYAELRARNQAILSWLGKMSTGAWDDSAYLRNFVTSTGGFSSALGLTTPQSGQDVVAQRSASATLQSIKETFGACWDLAVHGSLKAAWQCLPTSGKVVLGGAAAYGSYRLYKRVRS